MAEQVGDRLSIVGSPDSFCKDHGDINHLERQEMHQVSMQVQSSLVHQQPK